ncbi:ABC transporter ATP-binding protein [Pseudomonas purpurea]|uniref:ABC transporter ATP-binding protein n=1 Tax=Pseudomonas purpurea TaxID=3136737 RepID=UPI0032638EDC
MVTLQLKNIGAHYGNRPILSGISTGTFTAGQVIAVVGPNAAGKSTLFKRMAGLLEGPGRVIVQHSQKGPDGICYMPQGLNGSARLTVYESILLARKQQSPGWVVQDDELQQVDQVLDALGISMLASRNLSELSGGQQQLVSIAQTLVREPEVLLMDEPTSALDMHRQVQVLNFMKSLARRRQIIVFIAIHDLNQALRFADQVLVIANGTTQGCGPSEEVITVQMLREVYRIETRIETCSRELSHILIDDIV